MKKIWLFLLFIWVLGWGIRWILWKQTGSEELLKRDCLNSLLEELGDQQRSLSWTMQIISGQYLPYLFVVGEISLPEKSRSFFCLSDGEKSYSEVFTPWLNVLEADGVSAFPASLSGIAALQQIATEIQQSGRDSQRIFRTSLHTLLEKKKAFHNLLWERKLLGNRLKEQLDQDFSWSSETALNQEQLDWYREVMDLLWVKQSQIPSFQKEAFVALMKQLLAPQGIEVFCSASLCDQITFSGHYNSAAELDQLVQEVRDLAKAFGTWGIVFEGNFSKYLPLRSYDS